MAYVRRQAADWAGLIDQWRQSGPSLPAFCQRHDLSRGTMRNRVYKRSLKHALEQAGCQARPANTPGLGPPGPDDQPPAFLPIRIADGGPTSTGVEVVLGPGRRIVVGAGFDPETLRRVVAGLEGRPCRASPRHSESSWPQNPPTSARASMASPGSSAGGSPGTRSRGTSSSSAIAGATGPRSSTGTATGLPCGTRSKRQTAPVPAPLQEFAGTPIISLAGLLRLAEWVHIKNQAVQGGDPCREADQTLLPPAPDCRSAVDARSTLESVDGRTASTNADYPQRDRASTTRRTSRRHGGVR
jgi:hypothetical protein